MSGAREFYVRNAGLRGDEAGEQQSLTAMRAPGHRYYCVIDCLPDPGRLAALELGFGSVAQATALARLFGRYEAVDVAADALLDGRDVAFGWKTADLDADWPYDDASWDVVLAMMIIEHLYDPFHAFRELSRVLRPGGRAFVNLPNIGSIKCRLQLLAGWMPVTSSSNWYDLRQWDGGHLHHFTVDLVRRLAVDHGLALEAIYPVGRMRWLKALRPALFCHEISYVLAK